MRDLKERFGGLPFSIGCVSVSSVAVIDDHPNKSNAEANPAKPKECGRGEERCNDEKVVKSPSNGAGFSPVQKLIKSFKSFSQRLSYRQEEDEDEMVEMEIGLPTDVIHVGHIGWDGSTNTIGGSGDGSSSSSSSSSSSTSKIMSLSSAYLRQIELAMAAHADVATAQ